MSAKTVLATAVALAPLLAACSSSDNLGRYAMTSLAEPATPPLAEAIAPGAALAALPLEAGRIVSVVQTRRADGVDQKITLVGDAASRGDNEIAVRSRVHQRARQLPPTDEASILAEMAERLPGVAMTITPSVVVAPAGPIGIATGRTGSGVTCVYAWSDGTGNRRSGLATARLLGVDGPEGNDLEIRVRLCRHGIGEERLAAMVAGLRLHPDLQAATSGDGVALGVPAGSDALAAAGYAAASPPPVVGRSTETTVHAEPPAPAHVAPKPRTVAHVPRPATTTTAAAPAAPTVVASPIPLPSGG